jgi:hypothetical protein
MLPGWLVEITTIRTAEFSGSTERASSRSLRAALRFPLTRSMCAYAYISPTAIKSAIRTSNTTRNNLTRKLGALRNI